MGSVRASVLSQVLVGSYLQVVEWVPLSPWNNVAEGNGQERLDIAAGILQSALIYGTIRRNTWAVGTSAALYGLWLATQGLQWWWYLRGGEPEVARRRTTDT